MIRKWGNHFTRVTFIAVITVFTLTAPSGSVSANNTKNGHYMRSSKDLKQLAQREFDTILQLQNLHKSLQPKSSLLELAEAYIEDFAEDTGALRGGKPDVSRHVDQIVKNPISIFKLIQRVAYFLEDLKAEKKIILDFPLTKVAEAFGTETPFKDDLMDAARGILRIQFFYDLNATDLASGRVYGTEMETKLFAADCLYIGYVAKEDDQFALAADWLKEAERLAEFDDTADIQIVRSQLQDIIKRHDDRRNPGGPEDVNFFTKPLLTLDSMKKEIKKVRKVLQEKYEGQGKNCSFWSVNNWGLCAGGKLQTPKASSHLFCWFEFKIHKIFTVGPLKMEFLSRNPDIVQIYDAFNENELEEMMIEAGDLNPSVTLDLTNAKSTIVLDQSRVSSSNILKNEHLAERRMNRKVEAMTGFKSTEASAKEELQVVNYVPGGHHKVHVDSLLKKHVYGDRGDRIASIMVYMNDVEAGGYTAFPTALAAAVPTKGSALYWFNTLSDGSPDFSSVHTGCPVVFGQKSIANKWIRFNDQFSVRKCGLNPKERFRVPVNGKFLPVPKVFQDSSSSVVTERDYHNCKRLTAVDEPALKKDNERKYSYSLVPSLKALMSLDWQLFQKSSRIFTRIGQSVEKDDDDIIEKPEIIRSYLQDFNESVYKSFELFRTGTELADKLVWNPLAIYRTIWRFENYVKKLRTDASAKQNENFRVFQEYIEKVYDVTDGPSVADLVEAMEGLLRVHNIYGLKSNDMAKGMLGGIDAGIVLTAIQCIQIAEHALASDFYYQAVEWMETAVQKIKYEGDTTATLEKVEEGLETAKKMHDKNMKKSDNLDWQKNFYVSAVAPAAANESMMAIRQLRLEEQYRKYKLRPEDEYATTNYWGLCQGRPHQSPREQSKLFCWHETEIHPYWKIGPLRIEVLSRQPQMELVQYHDILSEEQMEYLRAGAKRRNSVAKEFPGYSSRKAAFTNSKTRLSTISWLQLDSSAKLHRIAQLMERATGLSVLKIPRPILQMATYAPGGHKYVHTDSEDYDSDLHEARVATLMFYLNDVESGGGTVFSRAGVHVTPRKGSAILWFNLLSSGDEDILTMHGACPVVFGQKIAATQWIPYAIQSHMQCDKEKSELVQVLVNGKSKYKKRRGKAARRAAV